MSKTKFLIAASLSLSLAGCGAIGANTSMYSVHQPVVERTNYAIDVNTDGNNGIPVFEQRRVGEWFDALKLGYGDRIAIDYGDNYANSGAQRAISGLAEKYGMLLGDTAPVTAGNVAPGTVRIVVTRSKASVPSCPDLRKTTEANYNSSNSSNYGCAANTNLAAMIADPEDLVRGHETAQMDNNSGNKAVKAFREKAPAAGGSK